MPTRLEWKGNELARRTSSAVAAAIADVTDEGATRARSHHPRWQSRSGRTEASIDALAVTRKDGRPGGGLVIGVPHGRFLERGFRNFVGDRTLARAGEAVFASLASRIRAHMERR